MGFCTICGKPLADGEVCTCQQTASQGVYNAVPQQDTNVQGTYTAPQQDVNVQGAYTGGTQDNLGAAPKKAKTKMPKSDGKCPFAPIIENAKDTIDNPLDAGNNYYKKATMKTVITSLVTMASLYVLTSLFNLLGSVWHTLAIYKRSVKPYLALAGIKYGDYLKSIGMSRGKILRLSGITGGTWVQAIFFPIVYMILVGVALVGIAFLVNKLILKKEKFEILNVAKFAAALSLPISVSLVARFLIGFVHVAWINGTVLAVLYFAGLLLALLQAFEIIREHIQDKKKYVIVIGILVLGMMVADYLVGDLFLRHFYPSFRSIPLVF